MAYFTRESVKLFLPSNPDDDPHRYWVRIKAKLTGGDARYRTSRAMKVRMDKFGTEGVEPEITADYEASEVTAATLERAILDWNLTRVKTDAAGNPVYGSDGTPEEEPVDVTREAIDDLSDEDTQYLIEEINARNPTRSKAEKNG